MVDRPRGRESPEANAHVRHYYTRAGREWLLSEDCTHVALESAREYVAQAAEKWRTSSLGPAGTPNPS